MIAVATAWQMLDECVDASVAVWERSLEWRSLKWATEERRAFSAGERIDVDDDWSAERSGEGWPERQRRISWSMLTGNCMVLAIASQGNSILHTILWNF